MKNVVSCAAVSRNFGSFTALEDVSFKVREGEIFGVVGPNGAGKTTLLNCLEGLDRPSSGHVEVLGCDPIKDQHLLAQQIGVQLQSAALPPRLTVQDALELYSALYERPRPWRELLKDLGIKDKANARVDRLSGGERQRVFVALALINRPQLAFLDELTTALDPQSRRNMWDTVEHVRDSGATVVLTTHYMEEAERLCDRVAIIDHGRLVALDTVASLIQQHAGETTAKLILSASPSAEFDLNGVPGVTSARTEGRELTIRGAADGLQGVLAALAAHRITVTSMSTTTPGLEDVFLALTGRHITTEEQAA
ncbi:ABC transporter ATP-binding protein [Corynebacterium afermentans subsp. lipophilum]|uniref:ABC transporter ATP-binding protein n=1 Tax=Corynebacterium afermentans TaxID=38286 RepID=UPI00188A747F|nr:ABC transporter ATP-binding protein [Corynebacterium afermentans]MBF4547058.1 ABC transporter ATP-binding protein [Corynebacterium afermentans subsp. lipophilum]WJY59420.1 Daunorubicin/doxorubicin resistance ATP-binding protein DrrA [Corynebacterium afermentans subsp. lipophilum]